LKDEKIRFTQTLEYENLSTRKRFRDFKPDLTQC